MKNFLIILLLVTGCAFNVHAQKNVVKFNPLPLIFGTAEVAYERVVGERQSAQLELGYTSLNVDGNKYTGFGVGAQYRFYLQKKYTAPEGWFAGPYAGYSSSESDSFKTTVFSGGAVIGYQWNWEPVTLDIYLGPGYFDRNAEDDDFDIGFDGLGLKFGVSLGVAF
jgi:hypothetical protein